MLDFRIDTFLEVCRCMNYTRTAERLNITQPAVSQHIRFLEESYGVKLFIYEGKKLKLTKEGEMLYRMVSVQKHDAIYLREKMLSEKETQINLCFGVTLTIGEFVIAKPLAELLNNYPKASIRIITANTQELLEKIMEGEIDFAIVEGNFPKEKYDSAIYSGERFIPVCGYEYRLAGPAEQIGDLLKERLIIREEGSGTREVLAKELERRDLSFHDFANVIEIGNMSAIKELTACGCGISFLYEAAVREDLERKVLRRILLKDFDITHNFSFVWQKGSLFKENYWKIFKELRKDIN